MSTKKEINSTKKLNKLLTNSDISFYKNKKYWEIFESFGYVGEQQQDRVLKLSAQLDACDILGFDIDYKKDRNPPIGSGFKDKVVCDVGCGSSPMALIFADMGAMVHAITKEPYDVESQHDGVVGHPQITLKTHVEYTRYSKKYFKDSSIDLFLDGCSITHFVHPPTAEICPSDACYYTGKEIARTMRDDGYLIVTSDVSIFEEPIVVGKEVFVSMRNMIKSFEVAGLKLFGEVSKHPEFSPPMELPLRRDLDSLGIKYNVKGIAVARLVFVKK